MNILKKVLSFLTYLYLLRFPLIAALVIAGLPVVSVSIAHGLLGNLFDINWQGGIAWVGLASFTAAWAVMVTSRIILSYGRERFGSGGRYAGDNVKWQHVILYGLLAVPGLVVAVYRSTYLELCRPGDLYAKCAFSYSDFWEIADAVYGLLASFLLLALAEVLRVWIIPPAGADGLPLEQRPASPDVFIPTRSPFLSRVFDRLRAVKIERVSAAAGRLRDWIARVPPDFGVGYFTYDKGRAVAFLPQHGAAASLFLVTFGLYVAVGVSKFCRLGYQPSVPTLTYVLLLVMLLCWVMSALTFFLDRFRIPVLVPLLIWFGFTSQFPTSDHFYKVQPSESAAVMDCATPTPTATPTPSPEPAASPPPTATPEPGERIIVVAANGGGIQAGAWAARVLTGLEEECRKRPECGDKFGKSIRLISSVSGGSVGAMYFANEYTEAGLPSSAEELRKIVERAEESSLDEVAWGLVYPDFIRLLVPFRTRWDRGSALEKAWLRPYDKQWSEGSGKRLNEGLAKWGEGVRAGWRPGSIFNTTISDTGERLPLSTVELPEHSEGRQVFCRLFPPEAPPLDIPVVTAARLSAAFPYVSPASRADAGGAAPHIVDGGYYDNYGISSLVEWLDREMRQKGPRRISDVLVIQIRGAPSYVAYEYDLPECEGETCPCSDKCPEKERDVYKRESRRGWFYQFFAPLSTLLHVRDTGQQSHNNVELRLLREKWALKGEHRVVIKDVVFQFDGADPPLSWHLNRKEKRAIECVWEARKHLCPPNRDTPPRCGPDQHPCSETDFVLEFLTAPGGPQ